jgi:hypothetical protein
MQSEQNQLRNLKWTFRNHSVGMIAENDFQWVEEKVADAGPGQVLVRNLYLSLDPTNRVWMGEKDTYMPALKQGEVMRGLAIGVVEKSDNPQFKAGDWVQGLLGWQKYLVSNGEGLIALPAIPGLPLEAHFGLLGHIGLTAHYGLLHIGKPKPGETVVVSAAAGAVGSLAGQIAKIHGCRVIGTAGSDDKCRYLTQELGFDAAINYKTEPLLERLRERCPRGIDVYFDNVGGTTLDAVLDLINDFGRIVACGMISAYNQDDAFTSRHMVNIVTRRILMQGFVCLDHPEYAPQAYGDLIRWHQEGKIKYRVDIVDGLKNAVTAINKLFTGSNQGKLLVKVS